MKLSFVFLLLIASISCNFKVNIDEQENVSAKPFTFPSLINLTGSVFDSGSNVVVTATAIDQDNDVYVLINFTGSIKGIPAEDRDVAILKINSSGTLLWKIHFNSSHPLIADASLEEKSTSMIWDENEKALYFMGSTLSPLIEPNSLGASDLFIGKVSGTGKVLWIRHFGETTISGPGLDVTKTEAPGALSLSPDKKLVVTFETYGDFFESSAGDADIAMMKLDPLNGNILSGRQLGGPTLTAYGILHSIPVNGTLREGLTTGNIAFDGTKAVVPIRTRSSLVETNPNTANNDAGYVIFNEDLSIHKIKQLGSETYSAWVSGGHYSGSLNLDNQFRGVVVNGPEDYLFFGKTNGNVAEVSAGISDYLLARYKNHSLVNLVQYGATIWPHAVSNEEPRFMLKDSKGHIYCSGHSRSSLYDTSGGNYTPVIMRVDEDGNILAGAQFGQAKALETGLSDLKYTLVMDNEFAVKDGRILLSISNDPVGTTNFTSYLWSLAAP